MVTKAEAARLLTVASGFDRFIEVNDVTAGAWSLALSSESFEDAQVRLIGWYRTWDGKSQLSPRVLLKRTSDVEADVRSAKARGLIERDWPPAQPLPPAVAKHLSAARGADLRPPMIQGAP